MKQPTRILIVASATLGLAVATFMMFIAWEHNPQGTFHEPGPDGTMVIHWGAWSLIGLSWFVPVAAVPLILGAIVATLRKLVSRRP